MDFGLRNSHLSMKFLTMSGVVVLLNFFFSLRNQDADVYIGSALEDLIWLGGSLIFLASDFILFFVGWEIVIIPIVMIAAINKRFFKLEDHAWINLCLSRFVVFTQLTGFLMLGGFLYLAFSHFQVTGLWTLDFYRIDFTRVSHEARLFFLSAILIAAMTKLACFPLHGWIASMYRVLPASTISVGLLIKTSSFVMLQWFEPQYYGLDTASLDSFGIFVGSLGAFGVIYGAVVAFRQEEIRAMMAYASMGHMGLLMIAFGARCMAVTDQRLVTDGILLLSLSSGLAIAGVMHLTEAFEKRGTPLKIGDVKGLVSTSPTRGWLLVILMLATIGVPGFANFAGEFLVLVSTYAALPIQTIIAAAGSVLVAVYGLRMIQDMAFGKQADGSDKNAVAIRAIETLGLTLIVGVLIYWGVNTTSVTGSFFTEIPPNALRF